MGARVALVGHAHRARPLRARTVATGDVLGEVGDEALVAAHALSNTQVAVVVAPRRADAIAFAAEHSDVIILDGVAQTTPVRVSLALLAVDAHEPWGQAANVPPAGDLRAPEAALRAASDAVVAITDPEIRSIHPSVEGAWPVWVLSQGVRSRGAFRPWTSLEGARVGLVCAEGRPHRVLRFLEARGVTVCSMIREPDHGPLRSSRSLTISLSSAEKRCGVNLWLATEKCAVHLDAARQFAPNLADVASIDYSLVLGCELVERLRKLGSP
jgi:tetraacyldisaccharide 4'-kinase